MSRVILVLIYWSLSLHLALPTIAFDIHTLDTNTDSLYNSSLKYYSLGRYDSANLGFIRLNRHYEKEKNQKGMASGSNYLGVGHYQMGNLDSSLYYYFQALDKYHLIKDTTGASSVLLNIGIVFKEQGNYERATEYLLEAIENFEQGKDSLYIATCYNTLANINSRQRDYQGALKYHFKALNIRYSLKGQQRAVASSLNNIGLVFQELEQFDSAIYYYETSLKLKRELKLSSLKSTLNNLGIVLLDLKRPTEARDYLLEARKVNASPNDESMAVTLNGLGSLHLQLGDELKASLYLDSAIRIIEKQKFTNLKKDNLKHRIELLRSSNPTLALALSKELLLVNDSLYNKERAEALAEMQTKYETEKKEQSITLLRQEKDLQTVELQLNRLWLIILIISILLAITIALLVHYRFRRERKDKHKIETLMQELHHRVKNNLQLLSSIFSLQSKVLKDKYALDAVRSGENRVNAMALVHQQLYRQSGERTVNIKDYISKLIDELAATYGYSSDSDDIHIDIEDCEMDVDKVIPIGLIVNELVSNSFKYAFSQADNPRLVITISKTKGDFLLRVSDNGPGFEIIAESKKSMGLNIIETLGRQLNAKVNWATMGSVEFKLTLPLN
ncbi:tetratricopeptide repeat protein [Fulvivirga sp.]|uniref:tetratricopeptide repeat protein n=1 Tax=Fulvivirga sp. TaxID=1931237 RepID=UPI0032EFC5D7